MNNNYEEAKIRDCDFLVIGSSGGAMCAAVTASQLGLDFIVTEKQEIFGGATARSGGWLQSQSGMSLQEV